MADRLPPLIPQQEMEQEQPQRGNRTVLWWIVIGGGIVLVALIMWMSQGKQPIVRDLVPDRPPPEQTVVGTPGKTPDALLFPPGMLSPPTAPPADVLPPSTPGGAPPPHQVQAPPAAIPAFPPPPKLALTPPPPPAVIQAPRVTVQAPPPAAARPVVASTAPAQKETPRRWYTSEQQLVMATLEPPFKDDPQDVAAQEGKLFVKPRRERPADPYKVLYWHQTIKGQLFQDLNSDIPGVFLVNATEDVMDQWGHGHVIVPRDTWFLGKQEGQANFGQERLPATIVAGNYPDGSSVEWEGQVQDQRGANGIPMNINNHWIKLFIGTGLQVLLNFSTRGTQQALGVGQIQAAPQELGQDVTRGINQAARPLLERFNVKPTLTQDFGEPVTIRFLRNISLQTSPTIIAK